MGAVGSKKSIMIFGEVLHAGFAAVKDPLQNKTLLDSVAIVQFEVGPAIS